MQSSEFVHVEPNSIRPVVGAFSNLPPRYRIYPLSTTPARLALYDADTERHIMDLSTDLVYQPSVRYCRGLVESLRILDHIDDKTELRRLCASIGVPYPDNSATAARLMVPMDPDLNISNRISGKVLRESFNACIVELEKVTRNVFTKSNLPVLLAIPGAYALHTKFRDIMRKAREAGIKDNSQILERLNTELYAEVERLMSEFTRLRQTIDTNTIYLVKSLLPNGTVNNGLQCIMGFVSPYSFPHYPWLCVTKLGEPYRDIPSLPKCISTGFKQTNKSATSTVQILGSIDSNDPITADVNKKEFWAIVQTIPSIKLLPEQSLYHADNVDCFRCFKQTKRLIRIVAASWICTKVIVDYTIHTNKMTDVYKKAGTGGDYSTLPKVIAEDTPTSFATHRQPSLTKLLPTSDLIYIWTTVLKNMRTTMLATSPDVSSGYSLTDVVTSFLERFSNLFWTDNFQVDQAVNMPLCLNPSFFTVTYPSRQLVMTRLLDLGDELFKFNLQCGSCFKIINLTDLFQQWKFRHDDTRYQLMNIETDADCMAGTFLGTTIVMPYDQEYYGRFYVIRNNKEWKLIQEAELRYDYKLSSASVIMFNNLNQFGLDAPIETENPTERETHAMIMAESKPCNFETATVNKPTTFGMVNVKWDLNLYKWVPELITDLDTVSTQKILIYGNHDSHKLLKLKDNESVLSVIREQTAKTMMFLTSFLLVNSAADASSQNLYEWGLDQILSKQPSDDVNMIDMHESGDAVVCYLDGAKSVTIGIVDNHLVVLDKKGVDKEPRQPLSSGTWRLCTVIDYPGSIPLKAKNTGIAKGGNGNISVWFINAWYAARWNNVYGTTVTPTQHIAGMMTLQAFARNSEYKDFKMVGKKRVQAKRRTDFDCKTEDRIRLVYKTPDIPLFIERRTGLINKIDVSVNDKDPLMETTPQRCPNAKELFPKLGICTV